MYVLTASILIIYCQSCHVFPKVVYWDQCFFLYTLPIYLLLLLTPQHYSSLMIQNVSKVYKLSKQ